MGLSEAMEVVAGGRGCMGKWMAYSYLQGVVKQPSPVARGRVALESTSVPFSRDNATVNGGKNTKDVFFEN